MSVTVVLKTNGTSGYKLDEGKFELDAKHRLPVREIERRFNVSQLHWIEGNEPLPAASDGYSSIAFELYRGKVLDIACNPNGPRPAQEVVSRPTNVVHHTTLDHSNSNSSNKSDKSSANVPIEPPAKPANEESLNSLTAKNEEDRLLKSLNKKRATAASNTIFSQPRAEKAAPAPAPAVDKPVPAAAAGAVPAWKKKRDEDEAAIKAQMAVRKVPSSSPAAKAPAPAAPAPAAAAASLEDQARQRQAQLDLEAAEEARLEKSLFGKGAENRRSATLKAKKSTGPADAPKVEAEAAKAKASIAAAAAPAAPAAPAAVAPKATQPANTHADSSAATAIHAAAAVLYSGPHGSGDVKALVSGVKDAAESLEIDAFVAALGKLFAAGGGEAQLGKLRAAVAQAQAVAVNGQRFADDPDNESAMEEYSTANAALVATLESL